MYAVEPVARQFNFVELKTCPAHENDYVGQQINKLQVPLYVKEYLIYHMDSDCMFRETTDLRHYLRDGMPLLRYRTYDELHRGGFHVAWQ